MTHPNATPPDSLRLLHNAVLENAHGQIFALVQETHRTAQGKVLAVYYRNSEGGGYCGNYKVVSSHGFSIGNLSDTVSFLFFGQPAGESSREVGSSIHLKGRITDATRIQMIVLNKIGWSQELADWEKHGKIKPIEFS